MLEQDDKTLATSGNEYAQCVPAGEGVNGKTSTANSYQLPLIHSVMEIHVGFSSGCVRSISDVQSKKILLYSE